uniref:ubiquitinyl hydrolase 1 n=1 Tax=Kalanchoe fedtschenkoi TaxID=63787 RepID=A0A7N0TSL3_KALFE
MARKGGMVYHEVQESKLCTVDCVKSHVVNTLLQGPFFSEADLVALTSDLDSKEHQLITPHSIALSSDNYIPDQSHNLHSLYFTVFKPLTPLIRFSTA